MTFGLATRKPRPGDRPGQDARIGVFATTSATGDSPSRIETSPKKSPRPSVARGWPSTRISPRPRRSRRSAAPASPWRRIRSPPREPGSPRSVRDGLELRRPEVGEERQPRQRDRRSSSWTGIARPHSCQTPAAPHPAASGAPRHRSACTRLARHPGDPVPALRLASACPLTRAPGAPVTILSSR